MKEDLRLLIAEFWGIDKNEIGNSFRFGPENIKNFSSLRFYRFIAAIEDKLHVSIKNLEKIIDVKTLEENMVLE